MIVFLKDFFEKVNFEKTSRRQQKHKKSPSMQRVNPQSITQMITSGLEVIKLVLKFYNLEDRTYFQNLSLSMTKQGDPSSGR